MKPTLILATLLFAAISLAQVKPDEVAIRKILREEVAAWNKGDAQTYSQHFAIALDANGNVSGTVLVWSNTYLNPVDTRYFLTAFSSRGQECWGRWSVIIPAGDTYDLSTLIPQNQ